MMLSAVPAPPASKSLPVGFRVCIDPRVRFWSRGALLVGGAPWRIARIDLRARPFVEQLRANGTAGAAAITGLERSISRLLIDRGFAYPIHDASALSPITVVVPAYGRTAALGRCLDSLRDTPVLVVDDYSPDSTAVATTAAAGGARLVRHSQNLGPATARNTGLRETSGELVAFMDSDCTAEPGWLQALAAHFADPLVALVAPRVLPDTRGGGLLARHELARSALDMGAMPELVKPGARLGFVPSAAVVVRRSALGDGFDESLRVGEDVDLVWRLTEAGWHVRFDPSIAVTHEARTEPVEWITRRFQYGTSAADLAMRHPEKLAPVRVSGWNVAALAFLAAGRPRTAIVIAASASALLLRRLALAPADALLAPVTVATGVVADGASIGHALRREWWPVGALCLRYGGRSRAARAGAVAMLAPVAWEYASHRPRVDPARYTVLRLIEDAAYGSGVIASAIRRRTLAPLTPQVRLPFIDVLSRRPKSSR
jgi:mycofactocin system glycosyltransferase